MKGFTVFWLGAVLMAASSFSARAQQTTALPIVGVLTTASASSRTGDQLKEFELGLKDAGYIDNQNVKIEYQWADNDYSRLPELAAMLVQMQVKVIVAAGGHVSALAAHKVTKDIPIVFTTVTDPVKDGLVTSLNNPGGNATGTAGLTSELDPKRLEILHELDPSFRLIGVLVNPKRPGVDRQLQELQEAAGKLELELDLQKVASEGGLEPAFQAMVSHGVHALIVTADPFFNNQRSEVVALAAKYKLPTIYQWREFVTAGGLMSFGPSITAAYRHAGLTVGRILKGERPAEIPVVQPTKFQLVVNLRTAKRLGIAVPEELLTVADDTIE